MTAPTSRTGVRVVLVAVTTEPLDLAAHEAAVADRRAGAVVSFQGVVRDHDHGRAVTRLEYEGHPSAGDVLREVADRDRRRPCGLRGGRLAPASGRWRSATSRWSPRSAPRTGRPAFAACARLVDEVKARLPVWKRQVFADGTEEWVNCP